MAPRRSSTRSRVLLVGAGTGEATCGILYLASFLRRGGVEAFVRLRDHDEGPTAMRRSLERLLSYLRPGTVGISLKWFHHLARAVEMASIIRSLDPSITIVVGGNSATWWQRELVATGLFDHVVLGDGEVPLLALCRGEGAPPNVASAGAPGQVTYTQGPSNAAEVYYSHFDELFLSELDLASYSGWVAPGRGCGENCLYCSGTRGMQKATFGRAMPFLRRPEDVRRDHQEVAPRTWQLRYDFAGSTAAFLDTSWAGVDLSGHCVTYFLWGVPPVDLPAALSRAFGRVYMVVDVGCFGEDQRLELLRGGLLKPCPRDDQLLAFIDAARQHPRLELEISGIAGLPFTSDRALAQERTLVRELLRRGCMVGYQRLEAQPGALVTEHPHRFGMSTGARTFDEFLRYFRDVDPSARTVPMVRFADDAVETKVQATAREVEGLIAEELERRAPPVVGERSTVVNRTAERRSTTLGRWLGPHLVPPGVAEEPVTVLRSLDGTGIACAPSVDGRRFSDPAVEQGADAALVVKVLDLFQRPTVVGEALAAVPAARRRGAMEAVRALAGSRFLVPA